MDNKYYNKIIEELLTCSFNEHEFDYVEFYYYVLRYNMWRSSITNYLLHEGVKNLDNKIVNNDMFISYIIWLNLKSFDEAKLTNFGKNVKFEYYEYDIQQIMDYLNKILKTRVPKPFEINLRKNALKLSYDINKICDKLHINLYIGDKVIPFNQFINFNNLKYVDLYYITIFKDKLTEKDLIKTFKFIIKNEYYKHIDIINADNKYTQKILSKSDNYNDDVILFKLYLYFKYGILNYIWLKNITKYKPNWISEIDKCKIFKHFVEDYDEKLSNLNNLYKFIKNKESSTKENKSESKESESTTDTDSSFDEQNF